ncbi:SMR family transporter, partial [Gluconobacter albidus]
GYLVAFYCLSMALKEIPTGIAYAIWSGVGIVLVAVIAWIFQGQRLDLPAMIGMGLIIVGVLVMNLFSTTTGH